MGASLQGCCCCSRVIELVHNGVKSSIAGGAGWGSGAAAGGPICMLDPSAWNTCGLPFEREQCRCGVPPHTFCDHHTPHHRVHAARVHTAASHGLTRSGCVCSRELCAARAERCAARCARVSQMRAATAAAGGRRLGSSQGWWTPLHRQACHALCHTLAGAAPPPQQTH